MIFAPFGDDPVLVSQVTISNAGPSAANLRWIEYWGCQVYQFSFRAFIELFAGKSMHEMRRDFGARFAHHFRRVDGNSGLMESKKFLGRDPAEEQRFQGMVSRLEKSPNVFLTAPDPKASKDADFDDLNPPPTFLISLDAPASGMSTNGKAFFGAGGRTIRQGWSANWMATSGQTGPESALLLERKFALKPGESRTLTFLYGYVPPGADRRFPDRKASPRRVECVAGVKRSMEAARAAVQHAGRAVGRARSCRGTTTTCEAALPMTISSSSISFRKPAFTSM